MTQPATDLTGAVRAMLAGDELVAPATERTRYGRNGSCDVTVRRGSDVIAEFRGRSRIIERHH